MPTASDVLLGRDGWLFLGGGADAPRELYRHASTFDDALARDWAKRLDARASRLAELGAAYAHLIVPDKLTLLHEHLLEPLENPSGSPLRRLARLPEGRPAALLDVLPYFVRHAEAETLYWKSGSAWTPLACFTACQLLCGRVGAALNGQLLGYPFEEAERTLELGALQRPPRRERTRRYRFERHARRRHANALSERRERLDHADTGDREASDGFAAGARAVFENPRPGADPRTLVLFVDGCGGVGRELLGGMLAESFAEVHVIASEGIDFGAVARVRPDIVVTQGLERRMTRLPADDVDADALAAASLAALEEALAPGPPAARPPASRPLVSRLPVSRLPVQRLAGALRRAAPRSEVRRERLLDSETYRLDPPITVQPECVDDVNDTHMTTAPVTLVDVTRARVFFDGARWLIRTADGEEVLRHGLDEGAGAAEAGGAAGAAGAAEAAEAAEAERQWCEHRPLGGLSFLLGASAGAHCYYHWMLELLPRLGLLQRHGIDLGSIDHFLVREISGEWQLETLARLGIERSRIVATRERPHLACERVLHVEHVCGINLKMHRFVPMWMKHLFPIDAAGPGRRLYIGRAHGTRRGVANEAALRPLLERAGIEHVVMEGRSVREQAALLARAELVVAPHGGALANTVFCRPGTRVVELLSRHVYPYYYGLSASCGHVYHAVLENPAEDYPRLVSHRIAQSFGGPGFQSATRRRGFDVPLDAFERMLERL